MSFIDGTVVAVPAARKQEYFDFARKVSAVFTENGATRVVDAWGDDVPEGKVTSFPMAVQRNEDEAVVFSWIEWPSKEVRDIGWEKAMKDERMRGLQMPFDGKRMIFGGFAVGFDTNGGTT